MSLSSLFSLFSCATPGGNGSETRITKFNYNYDGTIGGNSHRYEVSVSGQTAAIKVYDMLHHDYGDMTDTVGAEFVQSLEDLCRKHRVNRFDGYDKTDRRICDGHGFSLHITYDNGKTVDAYGRNSSPKGFNEFSEEMHALFRPYCERMCEAALQKKKEKGVSGGLTFILMNFIQKGASGSDRYEVMISRQNIRQQNVEVRISSVSGEFFPEGDHNFYKTVPDEEIDWDAFAALVKKYNLTQWMDYEKAAQDYNNCEWFQMGFDFEEGHISAMGTEHPENYEAFRKDFLTLLRKTLNTD